jgi:ABC-type multidrug transport system ATPase subunit
VTRSRQPASLLKFDGVTRAFGHRARRRIVLDGIDLRVAAGSCVVLVGPNGSGKSTALRIAAGVLEPTSGVVSPRIRRPGVVLESERSFYLRLSARRNLEFFARVAGVPLRASRGVVDDVAAELGIEGWLSAPVADLSRGMRSLLALARSVLTEPRLLVLDEPLAGVDGAGSARVRAALETRRARGAGILMSGHSVEEARRWGNVLVHLRRASGGSGFLPRS